MEKTKIENKQKEVIIDAANSSLGRFATFAAKKALEGERVVVVNAEKAFVIGKPKVILEHYLHRFRRGHGVQKGPIPSRTPVDMCRRAIRGMVGWKKTRGREAYKLVRCYTGIPKQYEKSEKINFPKIAINFLTLDKLCKLINQK